MDGIKYACVCPSIKNALYASIHIIQMKMFPQMYICTFVFVTLKCSVHTFHSCENEAYIYWELAEWRL